MTTKHIISKSLTSLALSHQHPHSATIPDKGSGLKLHTHRDNVHLTENGYRLVANTIISEAKMLRDRLAPQS